MLADWNQRATQVLDEYAGLRQEHSLCGKPERKKENFPQLRAYLRKCIEDVESLTDRDVARIRMLLARSLVRRGAPGSATWQEVRSRQSEQISGGWNVAVNGMIIEQQQILTTQNLAVLFDGLNLADALQNHLEEMARRCFIWICKRQQMKPPKWHAYLIMLKNTAYAWRQMIFCLSMLPDKGVRRFIAWADEHLAQQSQVAGIPNAIRSCYVGTSACDGRALSRKPAGVSPITRLDN